jgi:hypothetical protein
VAPVVIDVNKSVELQAEIDRLSEKLDVRAMQVGFRTNDGPNTFIADDGSITSPSTSAGNSASISPAASMTFSTGTAGTLSKVKQPKSGSARRTLQVRVPGSEPLECQLGQAKCPGDGGNVPQYGQPKDIAFFPTSANRCKGSVSLPGLPGR